LITLLVPNLAAARPLNEIAAEGALRVGTPADYAPYAVRAADGVIDGAEIELARAFAQSRGLRVELVPSSWSALSSDFAAGKFDLAVGGISVTPARAALGAFSIALGEDGKRPLVRCADSARYVVEAAIDRPEIRVIANPGGTNESFARLHFGKAALSIAPDNQSVPERLIRGEADVFVTDGVEADLIARRFPGQLCAASVAAPFTQMTKAWWLSGDAALKTAADAFLAQAELDGSWQAALDRFMR
jgi:cyclohexadienyl dehydratase